VLIRFVLLYFPSFFVLKWAILGLMRVEYSKGRLVLLSAIYGLGALLVRDVLGLYGLHTLLLAILYVFLAHYVLGLSLEVAVLTRAVSLLVVTASEAICLGTVLQRWGITHLDTLESPFAHILFGWLGMIPVLIVVMIVSIYRINIAKGAWK